jgi:hypothetical protein
VAAVRGQAWPFFVLRLEAAVAVEDGDQVENGLVSFNAQARNQASLVVATHGDWALDL